MPNLPIIKNYEDLVAFNNSLLESSCSLNIESVSIANNFIVVNGETVNLDNFIYNYVISASNHLKGSIYRLKKYDFSKLICRTHPDIFMEEYLRPFINNIIMMGESEFTLWNFIIKLENNEIILKALNNVNVEELFIPYFITSISIIRIFGHHKNLKKVHIQEGSKLKKIENLSFSHCKKLTEINLPEGLEEIGGGAFEWSGLKEIIIPSSVTLIKDMAFKNCEHLEKVIIKKDSKLEVIGADAFMQARISSIALPNNLMQIGDAAFASCTRLKEVCIPDSVKEVGESAFSYCSLRSIVLGRGIKFIPKNFANACYVLNSVIIKGDIEGVGKNAFKGVPIEEIQIPNTSPIITNADLGDNKTYAVKLYFN